MIRLNRSWTVIAARKYKMDPRQSWETVRKDNPYQQKEGRISRRVQSGDMKSERLLGEKVKKGCFYVSQLAFWQKRS